MQLLEHIEIATFCFLSSSSTPSSPSAPLPILAALPRLSPSSDIDSAMLSTRAGLMSSLADVQNRPGSTKISGHFRGRDSFVHGIVNGFGMSLAACASLDIERGSIRVVVLR